VKMPHDSFMKKNVNILLLLLITIVIVVVAGGTVYFQHTFQNITVDYNRISKNLSNTSAEMAFYKNLYNQTFEMLQETINVTEQEKQDLKQVYTLTTTELGSEIGDLNSSLNIATSALEETQGQLSTAKSELREAERNITVAYDEMMELGYRIESLTSRVNFLERQVESLQNDLSACQDG